MNPKTNAGIPYNSVSRTVAVNVQYARNMCPEFLYSSVLNPQSVRVQPIMRISRYMEDSRLRMGDEVCKEAATKPPIPPHWRGNLGLAPGARSRQILLTFPHDWGSLCNEKFCLAWPDGLAHSG